jgi:hypothetical protein
VIGYDRHILTKLVFLKLFSSLGGQSLRVGNLKGYFQNG